MHLLDYCFHEHIIQSSTLTMKQLFVCLLFFETVYVTTGEELCHRSLSMERFAAAFSSSLPLCFNFLLSMLNLCSPLSCDFKFHT